MMASKDDMFVCGYVALIGRPNVGKSSILNRVIGEKVSITTHKPQTTRHQLLGIHTTKQSQIVFVDTPGLHRNAEKQMNKLMNKSALSAMDGIDVVLFVVDACKWTDEDEWVAKRLTECRCPIVLVLNKIDQITPKEKLLPLLQRIAQQTGFSDIVPVSAKTGDNLDVLEAKLNAVLPPGPPQFGDDQVTDRSERFWVSEVIREKLMIRLADEIPYALTVAIDKFEENDRLIEVFATIFVERDGQKGIVIGKNGDMLKQVGESARHEMENHFAKKIMLKLWVKVKKGWTDDLRALQSLGYLDQSDD